MRADTCFAEGKVCSPPHDGVVFAESERGRNIHGWQWFPLMNVSASRSGRGLSVGTPPQQARRSALRQRQCVAALYVVSASAGLRILAGE